MGNRPRWKPRPVRIPLQVAGSGICADKNALPLERPKRPAFASPVFGPVPQLSRRHPQRIIVRRTDRRAFLNTFRVCRLNGPAYAH